MKRSDSELDELIRLVREGDDAATEELFRAYKQMIVGIARGYYLVGGDSEDLVQEGMIGFLKAVMRYDASREAGFDTYAAMSVRRQIFNAIKTANRDKNKPISQRLELDSADAVVFAESPEEEFLQNERRTEFLRACETLGDFEQTVLRLHLEEKSYAEIAERMGVDSKKIDNTLQSVKRKLKSKLQD